MNEQLFKDSIAACHRCLNECETQSAEGRANCQVCIAACESCLTDSSAGSCQVCAEECDECAATCRQCGCEVCLECATACEACADACRQVQRGETAQPTITTAKEALQARMTTAIAAPEASEGEFLYMPAGEHEIAVSNRRQPVKVLVDSATAAALNKQLSAVQARTGQRAYLDLNHADGEASFWPRRFFWREGVGVFVQGEWSEAGKRAIEGKTYRSFSPTFHVDDELGDPARVACNPNASLNFGGLVNAPAFHGMKPLFAKQQTGKSMSINQMKTNEIVTGIEDVQALKAKITQYQEREADRAIQAACQRGAIPPANEGLKAKWRETYLRDPEGTEVMLAGLPGAAVLRQNNLTGAMTAAASRGGGAYGIQSCEGPARVMQAFQGLIAKQHQVKGLDHVAFQQRGLLAKEMSAFFAKEIHGRADVLDMPLMAATSADDLGSLAGVLVSQRTLQFFRYDFPILGSVYTDFSDLPGLWNQTENTRVIVKPAVQEYVATLGGDGRPAGWSTVSAAETTDVPITLDKHVGVPICFDANTLASTARRLFDEQTPAQTYAIAKYFVDKIYALYTPANYNAYAAVVAGKVPAAYATFPVALGEFSRGKLTELAAILNQNEVPFADRTLLLNSAYYAKLANDPSLVTFWAGQQNPEIVTENQLPKLAKFRPIEAPNLPITNNLVGMALHKAGTVIKARLPNDYTQIFGEGGSYGNIATITTPDIGLSMLLVQYVNHTGGYAEQRMQAMLGAAKGDIRGGLCLTS